MKRLIYILTFIASAAMSCVPQTPQEMSLSEVSVSLVYDGRAYEGAGITVNLRELNGRTSYEAVTDASGTAGFSVLPGYYEASATFKDADDGRLFIYNGVNSNVTVTEDGSNSFSMSLALSETNQIIIKELYIGGCPKDDGSGQFQNDAYVILYNNSDTPADAGNICFGILSPLNSNATNKYLVNGILNYADKGWFPASQAIWWFETDVTINPWSQIVIAIKGAVDHTLTYSASVDLSNADYAMYDPEAGFNNESTYPAPSARIPSSNYLQTFPYSAGKVWSISVSSPAFAVFRHDNPLGLSQDSASYDLTGGEKQPCVKIPEDSVVDGVEVFLIGKDDKNSKRFTASVDAGFVHHENKLGYTVYRNVDQEATEAIEGNKERLVYGYNGGTEDIEDGSTDPSGIDAEASIRNGAKIIYKDTNNSTLDFHLRRISSLK